MASSPGRNLPTASPYRFAPRAPPGPRPALPLDLGGMAAVVWLLTVGRVALAVARAEPPGPELGLAFLVLFALPLLAARALKQDAKADAEI